jgi:hypothetical protein
VPDVGQGLPPLSGSRGLPVVCKGISPNRAIGSVRRLGANQSIRHVLPWAIEAIARRRERRVHNNAHASCGSVAISS